MSNNEIPAKIAIIHDYVYNERWEGVKVVTNLQSLFSGMFKKYSNI
jgi:hypothetical protein